MGDLVSVIVPIYNREKTITRCVNSIINQTYPDLEILLVNDGSTDSSLKICKECQRKDKRIRVFDKPNSGPGSARNLGIKESIGNYLMFVDADDFLDTRMVEELYGCAVAHSSDMVLCGYRSVDSNGLVVSETFEKGGLCDSARLLETLAKWNINPLVGAPWNKIYKRSIIVDNRISFPINQTWAEDLQFNLYVYKKKPNIYIIEDCLYNYTIGGVSLTSENNSSKRKLIMMVPAIKMLSKSYYGLYRKKDSIAFQRIVIMLNRFFLRVSAGKIDIITFDSVIKNLARNNYLSKKTIKIKNGFSMTDVLLCYCLRKNMHLPLALFEKLRSKVKIVIKKMIR